MNLNYLRYFLVAAETCSFTEASERLLITQPSLSVSIQKLEESLGVKLFERQKNRQRTSIHLTSSGKYFLVKAKDIIDRFELVKAELSRNDFYPRTLKIGILRTLPTLHITGLVISFCKALPNIIIEQVSGNMAELEGWLEEGEIQLAITVPLAKNEARRTSQTLYQQGYLAAIAEDHPLARRTSLTLGELDGLLYIDMTKSVVRDYLQRTFVERGICPKVTCQTEHNDLSNALVAAGVGLAVIPGPTRIPGVVSLPFSDLDLIHPVCLEWGSEQNLKTISLFREISTSTALLKEESCREGSNLERQTGLSDISLRKSSVLCL